MLEVYYYIIYYIIIYMYEFHKGEKKVDSQMMAQLGR